MAARVVPWRSVVPAGLAACCMTAEIMGADVLAGEIVAPRVMIGESVGVMPAKHTGNVEQYDAAGKNSAGDVYLKQPVRAYHLLRQGGGQDQQTHCQRQ
jgi:hypothetical protein